MVSIDKTDEWSALQQHWSTISKTHMRNLFAEDSSRFERFSLQACGLFLDYSKNRITGDTIEKLVALATRADLEAAIEAMYSGEKLNTTEGRAVLHTALRNRSNVPVFYAGSDVMPEVRQSLDKMAAFVEQIRSGHWKGYTGEAITDVVNLGIGGSDLGPKMVTRALQPYSSKLNLHFVSNLDGTHLNEALAELNPETTLFVISSKSFGTLETLSNARDAKQWLLDKSNCSTVVKHHFVAVSCNTVKAIEFGIAEENIFEFRDWVGGRFSLWSTIGLPIALALGMEHYLSLLDGAHEMDNHFRSAPLNQNMPVILALLGVWYRSFGGFSNHGIFPYDEYLRLLPSYLQQLDMESNGKSVSQDGDRVTYGTAPILWGSVGAGGQHSYFQLMHQGTEVVSSDLIAPVINHNELTDHQSKLLASMLAQAEALMLGRTSDEARAVMEAGGEDAATVERLVAHKAFVGDRPSNILLMEKLNPRSLGSLLALYEHKVFVQGVIWQINSFDQWGVELGKELAATLADELEGRSSDADHDVSTLGLLDYCRSIRGREQSG